MSRIPVIAIIDVGKTNKKLILFDEQYHVVYEQSAQFTETVDEDGYPCENLASLRTSVFDSIRRIHQLPQFELKALNFSTYGASFVYLGKDGEPVAPLYNYLKPYPLELSEEFYAAYGGEDQFSLETGSPILGSLNSGLQLYRIRKQKPELYRRIHTALHLPQYLSYIVTGVACADITSIGCHTALWNFQEENYHEWVFNEHIDEKLPPLVSCEQVEDANFPGITRSYPVGIGLHDSSAALIPYQVSFPEPFVLISTGTWCITLNPFDETPLTLNELRQDCLCYFQYKGRPVKASRIFAGYEHELATKKIAAHFKTSHAAYRLLELDDELISRLEVRRGQQEQVYSNDQLDGFGTYEEAYHAFMLDMVAAQVRSTSLVLNGQPVKRIFVDGGFSKNPIYMSLLAAAFPDKGVYAASMPQATALGAALSIHDHWNPHPVPDTLIELRRYSAEGVV